MIIIIIITYNIVSSLSFTPILLSLHKEETQYIISNNNNNVLSVPLLLLLLLLTNAVVIIYRFKRLVIMEQIEQTADSRVEKSRS